MDNERIVRLVHGIVTFSYLWLILNFCDIDEYTMWLFKGWHFITSFTIQETQESIRESIESQPVLEQRSYPLGSHADGNMYLHFPQFCGQDVRVYRQAPIKMPKLDKPKPQKQQFSITVVSRLPPITSEQNCCFIIRSE